MGSPTSGRRREGRAGHVTQRAGSGGIGCSVGRAPVRLPRGPGLGFSGAGTRWFLSHALFPAPVGRGLHFVFMLVPLPRAGSGGEDLRGGPVPPVPAPRLVHPAPGRKLRPGAATPVPTVVACEGHF